MHSRISCKRSLGCVRRSGGLPQSRSVRPSVRQSVGHTKVEFPRYRLNSEKIASGTWDCHWKDKTSMQADHQNASDDLIWLDLLDAFSFLFFFVRLSVRPSVRQLVTQIDNLRNAIFGWSFDKIASWTWNCVFWGTIWRQIREQIARMHLLA